MAFWVDLRAILQIVETSGNTDKANPPKQKNVKRYWTTTTFTHLDKIWKKANVQFFF